MYLNRNSVCDNIILLTKIQNTFVIDIIFFKAPAYFSRWLLIQYEEWMPLLSSLLFYTFFILLSREFDGTSYWLILLLYLRISRKRNMQQTLIIEKVRISNKLLLKARNIALIYNSLDLHNFIGWRYFKLCLTASAHFC